MATMLPSRTALTAPDSERRIWEAMSSLPDDWTIVRTQHFSIPSRLSEPVEGELDFLLIDPARGCVGFEVVHGTSPKWIENSWVQTNKQGYDIETPVPGSRTRRAMHKLSQYLGTQPAFRDWKRHPSFGWGVILPEANVSRHLGPELPVELTVGQDDLDNIREAVNRVFRWHDVNGPPIDDIRLDVLIGILTHAG